MSFSSDVKKELNEVIPLPRHCRISEAAGFILFCQKKSVDKTDNSVLKSLTDDLGNQEALLKSCKIVSEGGKYKLSDTSIFKRACCKRSFVRGAFLACGNITNPEDEYHLEFLSDSPENLELLNLCVEEFELVGNISERRNRYSLYFKDAEKICDMLNVMEAHVALMEYENQRILKELRNNVNRRVNCETSNLKKTVAASEKACESINYLIEKGEFEKLPESLKEVAELRLEHPEKSLSELGTMLHPPIGRSGVNHRIEKLMDMARDMRRKEEEVND